MARSHNEEWAKTHASCAPENLMKRSAASARSVRWRIMPYQVYKVLHVASVLLLFASLGGLAIHAASDHNNEEKEKSLRILLTISHGIALVIILVAGFGLLARIGIKGSWPTWVYLKIVLWVLLGASVAAYKRMPAMAKMLFFLMPLLGALAAGVAIYKPGHEEAAVAKVEAEVTKAMPKAGAKVDGAMADKAAAVAKDEAAKAAATATDPAADKAAKAEAEKAEKEASP